MEYYRNFCNDYFNIILIKNNNKNKEIPNKGNIKNIQHVYVYSNIFLHTITLQLSIYWQVHNMCQFLFNINIATTIIISPFSLSMFIYKPLSISSSLNSLQQIVYAKLYFNKLQIINHKSYFMISE